MTVNGTSQNYLGFIFVANHEKTKTNTKQKRDNNSLWILVKNTHLRTNYTTTANQNLGGCRFPALRANGKRLLTFIEICWLVKKITNFLGPNQRLERWNLPALGRYCLHINVQSYDSFKHLLLFVQNHQASITTRHDHASCRKNWTILQFLNYQNRLE